MDGARQKKSKLETEAYFELIEDWGTHNYYEWNPPILAEVEIKLPVSGHIMWRHSPEPDPWELLAAAVIRQAIDDYSHAWKLYKKHPHPLFLHEMQVLEETFFNRNDFTEDIFEQLKTKLEKK